MKIIDPNSLSFLNVGMDVAPCDMLAVPTVMDFSLDTQYTLTLQNMQSRDFIGKIRGLWINNGNNSATLSIGVSATGQNIKVPPLSQGYLNLMCPNPASLVFSTSGGVVCVVHLLNYEVSNILWTV